MADVLDHLNTALADRYTIERELGRGGMATVYLAQDVKHERQVAVKVLRPELAAALGAERFLREIKITANLNHPHILPLLDSGSAEAPPGSPTDRPTAFLFYVMPYVEGESLRDRLNREKQLPIADALKIAGEVADALGFAHEHNVIHRDIKPENILLEGKHAVVADFGVARAIAEAGETRLTETGIAIGTPAYLSPEQASADRKLDGRSDIYALGCVLYEMLAGEPPFTGPTAESIIHKHLTVEPLGVTSGRPTVPEDVAATVAKALAKTPADRFQTAEEVGEAIAAAQLNLVTPSGGSMSADRVAKRRWMMAGGAVAVVTAVIVVVAVLPRGSGVALDPGRVLVAVLENQTGDPSLDPLGVMAGHWITQGLQQSGVVHVVPWPEAQQASRYVASEVDAGNVRSPVTTLADETGAGIVISGAYYRRADSVQYQVEVTDVVRGQSVGALDPESAPLESPDEAIEPMRQRVMGLLAVNFDERIDPRTSSMTQPPSLEAYKVFSDGLDQYSLRDWTGALPYFYRASALDTTFAAPLIYATLSHYSLGQLGEADSLVGILDGARDRLSKYDRYWLAYLRAFVDGDMSAALRTIRQAAEMAPGSKAVYNWAFAALHNDRPQEAIDALLSLDPDRGPMRGWQGYFRILRNAYSRLGESAKALETARKYREVFGDDTETIAYEAMSLAELGRVDEINSLLDELAAISQSGIAHGNFMVTIAANLRRHGHIDAAHSVVNRALEWLELQPSETKRMADWRWAYASALYIDSRCDEALGIVKALSEEFPEDIDYRGLVGVVAACRGDDEQAVQISRWLETLNDPSLRGRHTGWRSRVEGSLGHGEAAVALCKLATAEGSYCLHPWDRYWIAFESLRDYPPFQDLMRPKG